jgi:hypothetical protein
MYEATIQIAALDQTVSSKFETLDAAQSAARVAREDFRNGYGYPLTPEYLTTESPEGTVHHYILRAAGEYAEERTKEFHARVAPIA